MSEMDIPALTIVGMEGLFGCIALFGCILPIAQVRKRVDCPTSRDPALASDLPVPLAVKACLISAPR
jgi:hypothetical protein